MIERADGEEASLMVYKRSVERDWCEGQDLEPFTGEVVAEEHVLFRE